MGQLVAFGGSPVLNRAVVSEGSLYGSPVHWPQPINSKSLHRSTGAGKGAVTCPRPSYYFNTLCLPLRSFYLSDFSRTHHLRPSRGQTGASRQEARGGVKWFIGNVCYWVLRKGSARMDREEKCGGKQLVMNLTAMGAVYGVERLSWPQNSSWEDSQVLADELLQLSDGHMAQTVRNEGGWMVGVWGRRGRGVIYFTTMSLFMGHTTRDGLKCYCPQEEDQRALPKCYSSSDRLTQLMCAPPGFVCLLQTEFTM